MLVVDVSIQDTIYGHENATFGARWMLWYVHIWMEYGHLMNRRYSGTNLYKKNSESVIGLGKIYMHII